MLFISKTSDLAKRTIALLTVFCLTFASFVGLTACSEPQEDGTEVPNEDDSEKLDISYLPAPIDEIIWGPDPGPLGMATTDLEVIVDWNGVCVYSDLKAKLDANEDDVYFAVYVIYSDYDARIEALVAQYRAEQDELKKIWRKLDDFYKPLKTLEYTISDHGAGTEAAAEAIQKWYEKYSDDYGKEFLDLYVVNGEPLLKKLEDDTAAAYARVEGFMDDLAAVRHEYFLQCRNEIIQVLKDAGYGEKMWNKAGFMFLTKKELREIKLDDLSKYAFCLLGYEFSPGYWDDFQYNKE